ncbi:MAG: carboxypeptidase-like regulatory domain-containing protein [Bacteroidales bacterium]|nr:carboxypeptidase-like regulatory domain-containing protein [Bacteroidales bacterium]
MKTTRIFTLLFFLLLVFMAHAQERTILQGKCVNENGRAIENVSVYYHDTLLVSITDENGGFTFENAKASDKLRFAHMAYEPKYYSVKDKDLNGKPVTISLQTKQHELFEVEVTANAPHIAFDNPVRSVLDYVISDDGIYLIAYRMRNTALLHLSFEMDTLHELTISSSYKNLYRDFYGFVHVISNDNVCQVGFTETTDGKKKEMFLYLPISTEKFYHDYAPIVAASDKVVITGRYAFYGLEQYYYCVTPTADTSYLLEHIVDEDRRDALFFMSRTGGLDRYTLYEMNFYPARFYIYNPIYSLDNQFYLFNYTDDETIIYDEFGTVLERFPLNFHRRKKWDGTVDVDKRWKQKMMIDRARKEFYTLFVNDGLCTLMRIDLPTGKASPVLDLSGYPFAEMMKVHDRVLYFLYPTGNNHRQALFQVKLDDF